ncbi:hypothetical protein ACROYT_G040512 [Oculina patagonica]
MSYFFSVVPAAESFVSPAAESSASPTAESPASPAAVPVRIPAADIDASLEVLTEENFGFMANFLKSSHEMIRLARYVDDRLSESNLRTSFPGPAASNGLPLSPDVVPQKFPGRPHRVAQESTQDIIDKAQESTQASNYLAQESSQGINDKAQESTQGSFNDGDMVLEAAKECVFLQHQMFEENWEKFDSQSETTLDSDGTDSDSSANECSVSEPSNEEYF